MRERPLGRMPAERAFASRAVTPGYGEFEAAPGSFAATPGANSA